MPNPTGVLLLHGYGGHRNSNWLGWLRKELRIHDIPVFAPDLPEPERPVLADHLAAIRKFADELGERPIIVAHSLAAVTARYFIEKNRLADAGLLLVAPVAPGVECRPGDWTPPPEFFAYRDAPLAAEPLAENVSGCAIFLSRDDPYIDFEPTLAYYRALYGERLVLREYASAGHFNAPAGYREFPDLLPYLLPS